MRCENGGPIADEFGAVFLPERFPFEWMQDGSHGLSFVIAGLDPAIHLLCKMRLAKWLDPRVKPYEIHTFRRAHPCLIAWKRVSPWSMTTGPGFP